MDGLFRIKGDISEPLILNYFLLRIPLSEWCLPLPIIIKHRSLCK